MPGIVYKTDLDNVDWAEMKATLRKDAFDNGRSPEQLKTSFENSYAACIASADHRIVGTARVLSDGVCNAYFVDVWTLSAYRRQGIATTMMQNLLSRLQGQHPPSLPTSPPNQNLIQRSRCGSDNRSHRHTTTWSRSYPELSGGTSRIAAPPQRCKSAMVAPQTAEGIAVEMSAVIE